MTLQTYLKDRVAPFVVAHLPQQLCWKAANSPLLLPYYHMVSDERALHVCNLYRYRSVTEFKADMDYLLSLYRPVTLAETIAALNGGPALPERAFHLTFDDGFREMHDVVMDILLAKGIPATFFLIADFVDNRGMAFHNQISVLLSHCESVGNVSAMREIDALLGKHGVTGPDFKSRLMAIRYSQRHLAPEAAAICGCDLKGYLSTRQPYLTSAKARTLLAKGFSIGAHSLDHPLYKNIDLGEQIRQTRGSMKFIADTFGVPCRSFAFPHMDAGVKQEFFEAMFGGDGLEISFGTGGMQPHFFKRNLERFTMEKTDMPAAQILARQYAKKLYTSVCGQGSGRN